MRTKTTQEHNYATFASIALPSPLGPCFFAFLLLCLFAFVPVFDLAFVPFGISHRPVAVYAFGPLGRWAISTLGLLANWPLGGPWTP
jgi:hypothetical protein